MLLVMLFLLQGCSSQEYPTDFPANSTQLNCSNDCRSQFDFCINQQTSYSILCGCNLYWKNCFFEGNCTLEGDLSNYQYDCQTFGCTECTFTTVSSNASLHQSCLKLIWILFILVNTFNLFQT